MLPLADPVAHRLDLRDYQRDAIAAIRTAADEGCRRQLLVLPTGAGKTVTFGALAHEIGGETLILAHRDELIRQAVDKLRLIWPDAPCGVVKASENDVHAQVVVASVQTLARERRRRQLGERSRPFDLVIVDECFPAGTLVGGRPIESLRPGDMVPSWDEATGRQVEAPVVAVMRREASALVRVTLDDGTIFDCTPNHPVMTAAGWCPAGALPHGAAVLSFTHHDDANRHDLHRMRDTRPHRHEATPGQLPSQWSGVLLDVVPRPMGVSIEFAQDGSDEPALRVAAHDRTEPDAQRREPREDEGHTAGDRPSAARAWRQRHRPDRPAGDSGGAARLADGGHLPDWLRAHQGGPADPLQDRHREPGSEGRGGGRRGLPFLAGPPSVGCSQGRVAHWRRVAGVEVLERRGDGRPGEGRGGNPVYNLEVAGTHTYLIGDGIVVHNCHHAAAKSYRDVLDYVGAGSDTTPWVWQDRADRPLLLGVTATPDRGDRVGLDAVFERIVFHRDMLWGIQSGFLADLRGLRVVLDIDLHKVKVRSGDYGDAELAEVLHNVGAPGIAVRAWHDHAEGRKTLVFTPTVALAHEMADSFLEAGVPAGVVHGEMDDRDRRDTLARFAAGDLQVLANCFDEETEVLTQRGWLGPDDIEASDLTAAVDPNSGAVTWEPIDRIVRRPRGDDEPMVVIKNQTLDLRVTAGHRMLWRTRGAHGWKITTADQLPDRRSSYQFRVAGHGQFPGVPLTDVQLEFLGLFATDGTLNQPRASIEITQADHSPMCSEIERILTGCGFDWKVTTGWTKTPAGRPTKFRRYRIPKGNIGGQLARSGWAQLEQWIDKSLCPLLEDCTREQFAHLLHGLWIGDGLKSNRRTRPNDGTAICGADRVLLDRVQAWAVVRGMACSQSWLPNSGGGMLGYLRVRDRDIVTTNNRSVPTSGGNPATIEPPGATEPVWCITNQTGTVLARRRGRVMVTGQCAVLTEGFDEPSVGCVILARPTRSRALYVQMLGRGTRRHPGKADCLVIDMVDAAGDHDLVTMPELFGLPLSALRKATVADAVDRVRADAEARQEAAAVLAEEINLWDRKFREAKLNWLQTAGAWVLATEGGFVALEETTPGWWRAVIKPRRGPFRLLVADVDLETAMSAGEDHVRRYAMRKALRARQSPAQATALVRADAPWRRRAPSEKMLGYAARVGASVAGMRTAGEVADAIDAAKAARDLARLPAELA